MTTNDQIEAYLIESELPFERVKEGFWIIHDETDDIDNIVVVHTPPVITFRVKVMELSPDDDHLELYGHLLRLNASSMIAGAYGLEDDAVVVIDSIQSENLDHNEFNASIDAIAFALREHYDELKGFAASASRDSA